MPDVAPGDRPRALPPFRPTDSPWFWGALFSLMALAGMALVSPKYAVRQRQIEGRFLGREQAHVERVRRAAGLAETDLAETAVDAEEAPPRRIVPLSSLAILPAAAAATSAVMLVRELRARRGPPAGGG